MMILFNVWKKIIEIFIFLLNIVEKKESGELIKTRRFLFKKTIVDYLISNSKGIIVIASPFFIRSKISA